MAECFSGFRDTIVSQGKFFAAAGAARISAVDVRDDNSDSKNSILQFDWFTRAVHVSSRRKSIRERRPGSFEVRFRWPPQR